MIKLVQMHNARFAIVLSFAFVLLAGCGGGGGGGGAAPPSPVSAATLTFGQANIPVSGQQIAAKVEAPIAAAQFAGELAQRFSKKGSALSLSETCSGPSGSLNIVLTDRDGDGIASAGDRVAANFDHCIVGLFADTLSGSLVLELAAPTALATGTINGVVQLDSPLVLNRAQLTFAGSFKIALTNSDLLRTLQVTSSAADDLRVTVTGGASEYFRALALSKSIDYERARNTVQIALRDETAAGTAIVSTPTAFTGYMQRAPDAGVLEMLGTNGKVRLMAGKASAIMGPAQIEFVNEFGTVTFQTDSSWMSLTRGFLWWDGQSLDFLSGEANLDTQEYAADYLRHMLLLPASAARTEASAVFRFQFMRPPVDLPQLMYRFGDLQDSPLSTPSNVAATVERHGALLLLRPMQPLSYGQQYGVQVSIDGVTWNIPNKFNLPDILVHDAEGHETKIMGGTIGAFSTFAGAR
jgi:hypothetical protein